MGPLIVIEENDQGLIEIKNFLQTNRYLIKDVVQNVPNFCLVKKVTALL